jgi:hypothetical protein
MTPKSSSYLNSIIFLLRPNQSLKLTEVAVDDFAARRWTDLAPMIGTSAQRTAWRRLFAAVSLAPVR